MGECYNGIVEVVGSNPIVSIKTGCCKAALRQYVTALYLRKLEINNKN